jgi:hypothetical protein
MADFTNVKLTASAPALPVVAPGTIMARGKELQ